MPAVGLGTVMRCLVLGRVVQTSDPVKFPIGFPCSCMGGVAEYQMVPFAGVNAIVPDVPMEWNLGPFSLIQGHTAWVGYKYLKVKAGETVVVSGAAGAVGSMACQLAKAAGARVIGIAGGTTKCAYVVDELGMDGCVDYKNSSETMGDALKRLCPDGIDGYFDNVGGPTLDAVAERCNCFARISMCGAISQYQGSMGSQAVGFKNWEWVLMRRMTVQGFVVVDHLASVGESFGEIGELLKSGKMKVQQDVRDCGVTDYVKTVNSLFDGSNKGKLMIRLPCA